MGIHLSAQVKGNLSIENVSVAGTDVYFDIYMNERVGSSGPIYLSHSDFVIFFDPTAFNYPQFSIESHPNPPGGIQGGYCSFVPTNTSGTNTDFCRFVYHTNLSASVLSANEIVVNLNAPSPNTTTIFNENIARIDQQLLTHRLGTFKMTGYNNTPFQFTWDSIAGLHTLVYSYSDVFPHTGYEVDLTYKNSQLIGTTSNENTDNSFEYIVFPNPADTYLSIELEGALEASYQLFDVKGRLLRTGQFTGQERLETDELMVGTYFLRLSAGDSIVVEKVVVLR